MDDYLALRQQLKQSLRAARLLKDSGGATDSIGGGKDCHAHNNYGRFFGRSETVFADKAAKETSNLWSKFKIDIDAKKFSATAKPIVDAAAMRKNKVQRLKETRDYSFLSSSFEAEICSAPPINRDCKRGLITKEPTKLIERGCKMQKIVKRGSERGEMTKKPTKLMEKGGKRGPEKSSSRAKKESKTASKQSDQKKKDGEGQKRRVDQKREREEANNAIDIIRQMFGYDPTSFSDDDEEEGLNMEASFADIQKEERRSAKIATKEDREELRKLETECRKKLKHMN